MPLLPPARYSEVVRGREPRTTSPDLSFRLQHDVPCAVDHDLVSGSDVGVLEPDDRLLRRWIPLGRCGVPVLIHPADGAIGVEPPVEQIEDPEVLRRRALEVRVRRDVM